MNQRPNYFSNQQSSIQSGLAWNYADQQRHTAHPNPNSHHESGFPLPDQAGLPAFAAPSPNHQPRSLARTHVAVAVKLLIVRAGRASELRVRPISPATQPITGSPRKQQRLLRRAPPRVAAGLLPRVAPVPISPGPTCAPAFPLAFPFSLWEARNTQRERDGALL